MYPWPYNSVVRAPGIDLGGLGFNSLSGHITFNNDYLTQYNFVLLHQGMPPHSPQVYLVIHTCHLHGSNMFPAYSGCVALWFESDRWVKHPWPCLPFSDTSAHIFMSFLMLCMSLNMVDASTWFSRPSTIPICQPFALGGFTTITLFGGVLICPYLLAVSFMPIQCFVCPCTHSTYLNTSPSHLPHLPVIYLCRLLGEFSRFGPFGVYWCLGILAVAIALIWPLYMPLPMPDM